MLEIFLLTLALTALLVALFWLVVAVVVWLLDGNLRRFRVEITLEKARDALPNREALEAAKRQAVKDIESTRIPPFRTGEPGEDETGESGRAAFIGTLLNEGIAENGTAVREDDVGALPGDSWLCDRRPAWFAALQLLPGLGLLIIFGGLYGLYWWKTGGKVDRLWLFHPALVTAITVICQLLWTTYLAWISAIQVDANFRLGIKRFGEQMSGFLGPGLQFILPLGIETPESVTLKLAVWGPREEGGLPGQFRIGGTATGNGNPEPGRFETQLLGFWPLEIDVELALGVYRGSPMAKIAWWFYLNQYGTLDEVGQVMAQIAMPIVFKTAREVNVELARERTQARPAQPQSQSGARQDEPAENPKLAKEALNRFVNRMPEMAGKILLALVGVGPATLGGFLIRRVAITAVIPGPSYREMMQSANKAEIERYNQDVIGQAVAHRWKRFQEQLAMVPVDQQKALIAMARQEVDRVLYERVGAGTDVLGALLSQLATKQTRPLEP